MAEALPDLVTGDDGLARCRWGASAPEYAAYHDTEWGRPVHGEHALFERITLEAFQSGLSWLTILRKREGFRTAFARFDPEVVARFDDDDRARLMADAAIVRNRREGRRRDHQRPGGARPARRTGAGRAVLVVRAGSRHASGPAARSPTSRPPPSESTALSKALKKNGFVFVGPTTAYAGMQACGLVDDHLAGCHARGGGRGGAQGGA